jgi:hypothetical protein
MYTLKFLMLEASLKGLLGRPVGSKVAFVWKKLFTSDCNRNRKRQLRPSEKENHTQKYENNIKQIRRTD